MSLHNAAGLSCLIKLLDQLLAKVAAYANYFDV